MDKLVEFLTSKIGYTIAAILGFIVPGAIFVFTWKRDLYMQLDIIKLLLLSFGISFLLFVPVLIICVNILMLREKIFKARAEVPSIIFLPIVMNVLQMMLLITIKVINNEYSMQDFVKEFGVHTFWIIVILTALDSIIGMVLKIFKKKKQ